MRKGMDRQEYITYALSQIDDNTVWCEIEKELSAHIDDREQYYRDIGYDDETAAQKAMEHMGSPEAAADGFSKVHKNYRRITAIIAMIMACIVILFFWFLAFGYSFVEKTMGAGISEAFFLMYIIGISVLGKRRNSRFICFAAVIDFILTYGFYFLTYIISDFAHIDEFCSRIVLKLVCLLTGDFECLSGFWQVGNITVAPYLTYLSIAFYAVIFVLLILVFVSVCMLKKPTYSLRKKHFAHKMFKIQKITWIFLAVTMLVLPFFGTFDEEADVTLKQPSRFDAVVIAQSDTPRPISEIPQEDIIVAAVDWYGEMPEMDDSILYIKGLSYSITDNTPEYMSDWIEKNFGNKMKYEVHRVGIQYFATKENVYIEFIRYNSTDPKYKHFYNEEYSENVCQLVSDNAENWYEVESIGEISAAIDGHNQVEIAVSKADEKM